MRIHIIYIYTKKSALGAAQLFQQQKQRQMAAERCKDTKIHEGTAGWCRADRRGGGPSRGMKRHRTRGLSGHPRGSKRSADIAHNFAYVLWICNFEIIIAKPLETEDEVRQGAPCEPCSALPRPRLLPLPLFALSSSAPLWLEQIESDWKFLQSFAIAFSSFRFDSLQKKDISREGKTRMLKALPSLWNWKFQHLYFRREVRAFNPHIYLIYRFLLLGALSPHFSPENSFSASTMRYPLGELFTNFFF